MGKVELPAFVDDKQAENGERERICPHLFLDEHHDQKQVDDAMTEQIPEQEQIRRSGSKARRDIEDIIRQKIVRVGGQLALDQ